MTKEHPDGRTVWAEPVSDEVYRRGIAVERREEAAVAAAAGGGE